MSGDEFVTPSVICEEDGHTPRAVVKNGDSIIFTSIAETDPAS